MKLNFNLRKSDDEHTPKLFSEDQSNEVDANIPEDKKNR